MAVVEIAKIQVRRGQELQTGMPSLDGGEFGWAEDTQRLYIGAKQDEGANQDGNVRILTDNDYYALQNLFAVALYGPASVASTSTYQYREKDTALHANTTTIAAKLDTTVNLIDYFGDPRSPTSILVGSTGTDITNALNTAIQDLFNNTAGIDTRRRLIIPAGVYTVNPASLGNGSNAGFELPPYTTLIGEGKDLTTLLMNNTGTSMFTTVQSINSTPYKFNEMAGDIGYPEHITIENMTLSYSTNSNITWPLVQIDLASNVSLKNVKFTSQTLNSQYTLTSTTTSFGTAIYMRGADYLPGNEKCKNISIEGCEFNGIGIGIAGTGTVTHIEIDQSIFENLQQGIYFSSDKQDALSLAPTNAVITRNKFKNIATQGIFVSSSKNRVNHVSENNSFYQVGNGGIGVNDLSTSTSYSATNIITFFGSGCKSVNDEISRRDRIYSIVSTSSAAALGNYYYQPLYVGQASVMNGGVYTSTIMPSSTTDIDVFYTSNQVQLITVSYKMYDDLQNYTRSGELTLNISESVTNFIGTQTYLLTNNAGTLVTIDSFLKNTIYTATNTTTYLLNIETNPVAGDVVPVLNGFVASTNITQNSINTNTITLNTNSLSIGLIAATGINPYVDNLGTITSISEGEITLTLNTRITNGTTLSFWHDSLPDHYVFDGSQFTYIPNYSSVQIQAGDILSVGTGSLAQASGTIWPINYLGDVFTATSTASYLAIESTNYYIANPNSTPNYGDAFNVATSTNSVYTLWVNTPSGWYDSGSTTTNAGTVAPNNFVVYAPYSGPSTLNVGTGTVSLYRFFPASGSVSDYYNYSYTSPGWQGSVNSQPTFGLPLLSSNYSYLVLQCQTFDADIYRLEYQVNIQ